MSKAERIAEVRERQRLADISQEELSEDMRAGFRKQIDDSEVRQLQQKLNRNEFFNEQIKAIESEVE